MAYATREDIEATFGTQLTQMIVDHGQDAIEDAEDALDTLIQAEAPQTEIDTAQDTLDLAIANKEPNALATINKNLEIGASTIDEYIKTRYPQTWTTPPTTLKSLNETIAVYWMALSADWRTEEMKVRYDIAIKKLEDIRDSKLDLVGGVFEEESVTPAPTGMITMGTWVRS